MSVVTTLNETFKVESARGRPVSLLNKHKLLGKACLDALDYHLKQKNKHLDEMYATKNEHNAKVHKELADFHSIKAAEYSNASNKYEVVALNPLRNK